MPSKVCDKCYGSGQISHVMGSGTSYQHCYQCDGAGTIYYSEPPPPPSVGGQGGRGGNPGGRRGTKVRGSNAKGLKTILGLAAGAGAYFLSVVYITDNLIIAGIIGIVALAITFKWHKQILTMAILGGLAYYFFFRG